MSSSKADPTPSDCTLDLASASSVSDRGRDPPLPALAGAAATLGVAAASASPPLPPPPSSINESSAWPAIPRSWRIADDDGRPPLRMLCSACAVALWRGFVSVPCMQERPRWRGWVVHVHIQTSHFVQNGDATPTHPPAHKPVSEQQHLYDTKVTQETRQTNRTTMVMIGATDQVVIQLPTP